MVWGNKVSKQLRGADIFAGCMKGADLGLGNGQEKKDKCIRHQRGWIPPRSTARPTLEFPGPQSASTIISELELPLPATCPGENKNSYIVDCPLWSSDLPYGYPRRKRIFRLAIVELMSEAVVSDERAASRSEVVLRT